MRQGGECPRMTRRDRPASIHRERKKFNRNLLRVMALAAENMERELNYPEFAEKCLKEAERLYSFRNKPEMSTAAVQVRI